ncbi:Mobile element protein [Pseudomonas chlororaphis]|uniref:Mobile element protein n=1 Tax=Pseudomonas chlororaphis TaxID=587753 RepID=A0A3G7TQW8_9PSED|nr:Mobile element protein [Pseudomonas chlororaphis]
MMRPDAKVEKVYLYPKPVDFRKSIDGLAALVELDIKVAVFDPVLFVFLNKPRNRVKILYWERNGFCLWLKRLETAPVTADQPAQLIEKSMACPSVLAMLLTTKYVDGLPLHRFEKVLGRHSIDIPRQTLARWVIQPNQPVILFDYSTSRAQEVPSRLLEGYRGCRL